MFEAKSFEIRRFFDLLGSIFCCLIIGIGLSQEASRAFKTPRILLFALFFTAGAMIYVSFYKLVWRFINTRILYGYANFLMISVLSASMVYLIVTAAKVLMIDGNFNDSLYRSGLLISSFSPNKILLFYWATSLPMASFWVIGILTAWKFSKREPLP